MCTGQCPWETTCKILVVLSLWRPMDVLNSLSNIVWSIASQKSQFEPLCPEFFSRITQVCSTCMITIKFQPPRAKQCIDHKPYFYHKLYDQTSTTGSKASIQIQSRQGEYSKCLERFSLRIRPRVFHGNIHSWASQACWVTLSCTFFNFFCGSFIILIQEPELMKHKAKKISGHGTKHGTKIRKY